LVSIQFLDAATIVGNQGAFPLKFALQNLVTREPIRANFRVDDMRYPVHRVLLPARSVGADDSIFDPVSLCGCGARQCRFPSASTGQFPLIVKINSDSLLSVLRLGGWSR
jgi:hypothetical protein